jgi:hypothetical protein
MQGLLAPIRTLVNNYLGAYAQDLDGSQLSLGYSIFSGNGKATLRDIVLRPAALTALISPHVPLRVVAGSIGRVHVDIPVYELAKKAVVVQVDDVFVQFAPALGATTIVSELVTSQRLKREVLAEVERHMMEAAATALLEASGWLGSLVLSSGGASAGTGGASDVALFEGLLKTALANLQVRVSRVHVRYEHGISRLPSGALRTVALGVTLASATVDTLDAKGGRDLWRASRVT